MATENADHEGSQVASKSAAETTPELREQVGRAFAFARRGLRYWYVAFAILILGGLACAGYFTLEPPVYRSETVLLHTDGIASSDSPESTAAPRNVAARVQEIVTSRQLLGRVLDEFHLYPEIQRRYGPVDAVDELKKHVQFKAPGGSTFRIAFDGDSPGQAERVTARLAELVIDRDSDLRTTQARLTQDFLAAEKGRTEALLHDTEHQLASFMAEHPRFALDTTPLTTGAAIRASVQGGVRTTPRPAPMRQARSSRPASMPSPAGPINSPTPSDAMREALGEKASAEAALAAARVNLADKLAQFTPAHPDVRAAQATVALAEARLADATSEVLAAPLAPPALAPPASPSPVEHPTWYAPTPAPDTIAAAPRAQDLVLLETEWATLTRNVIEARQHYDQVEAALFKADILASSVSGDNHGTQMSVIDRAFLPQRPVPPGRAAIAAIAGALSLLLGALFALVCAALDDRIYVPRDAARVADVLVEVPRLRRWRRAHVST
jgi:capsular polysaccharide biosynthesis protein